MLWESTLGFAINTYCKIEGNQQKRGKEGGKERGRKEYDGYARKERKWNQIKYLLRTCANAYGLSPPGPGPGPLPEQSPCIWLAQAP